MSVTRDKLYEEVWAEPMAKVTVRDRISANYLARVCLHSEKLAEIGSP